MKKVQVIWTNQSLKDLEIIYDFIAENSPNSAKKLIKKLLSRTRQLEFFPESGSKQVLNSKLTNVYRYLVEGNYKIIYHVHKNTIYVDAIFDTRENPENLNI